MLHSKHTVRKMVQNPGNTVREAYAQAVMMLILLDGLFTFVWRYSKLEAEQILLGTEVGRFLHEDAGQIGGRAFGALALVVAVAVAFIVLGALIPPAFATFFDANTTGWPESVVTLWELLPLLGVLVFVIMLIAWALLTGHRRTR